MYDNKKIIDQICESYHVGGVLRKSAAVFLAVYSFCVFGPVWSASVLVTAVRFACMIGACADMQKPVGGDRNGG